VVANLLQAAAQETMLHIMVAAVALAGIMATQEPVQVSRV
jgi:hypothetical protein